MKFKILTVLICFSVLGSILSFGSLDEAQKNVIPYKQLTWDDFKGFSKPLSKFDAEILADIQVAYDSSIGRYKAYAVLNKNRSWVSSLGEGSEDLLRHEQYHFDIAEYYAHILDEIIVDEKHKFRSSIEFDRIDIIEEMNEMQLLYDRETDHSLDQSMQRHWEYEIDSLLLAFENKNGHVNDLYSGAQVFLIDPVFQSRYDSIQEFFAREYYSEDYGMTRMISSKNYRADEDESFFVDFFEDEEDCVLESIESEVNDDFKEVRFLVRDNTEGYYHQERRIYLDDYTYCLSTFYYSGLDNLEGYKHISNSFLNSFSLVNNDQYWIDSFKKNTENGDYVKSGSMNSMEDVSSDLCYELGSFSINGFHARPIDLEDGTMIMPFSVPKSMKNQLSDLVLSYGGFNRLFKVDSTETIFHFPKSAMSDYFAIGYALKKDSLEDCHTIHLKVFE